MSAEYKPGRVDLRPKRINSGLKRAKEEWLNWDLRSERILDLRGPISGPRGPLGTDFRLENVVVN